MREIYEGGNMTQGMQKPKGKKNKKWKFIITIIIFIFLFFRSIPSLFASSLKTVLPERSIVEDKIETEAIIIRNEKIYRSVGQGKIEIYGEQGERVPVGAKIAKITSLDDNSMLKQQLGDVEQQIDTLKKVQMKGELAGCMEESAIDTKEEFIKKVQDYIIQEDYNKIEVLKGGFFEYAYGDEDIKGNDTLISQSIDNLKEKRAEIQSQISNNAIDYFSMESGILSFNIDGYEELYSFDYRNDYKYSDLKAVSDKHRIVSNDDSIKEGEPIFKIMDNFEWNMIIKIEDINSIASYKEGDSILLSGGQIEGELEGRIETISVENKSGVIIVKFTKDFHCYYNKRIIDVNIIKYREEGFKIPNKTIIEQDGIEGVFVREFSGIVKFRPISIIKGDGEFTYVSKGDKNYNIEIGGNDKPIRTVKQFDEILLNTSNIKEGMVIN